MRKLFIALLLIVSLNAGAQLKNVELSQPFDYTFTAALVREQMALCGGNRFISYYQGSIDRFCMIGAKGELSQVTALSVPPKGYVSLRYALDNKLYVGIGTYGIRGTQARYLDCSTQQLSSHELEGANDTEYKDYIMAYKPSRYVRILPTTYMKLDWEPNNKKMKETEGTSFYIKLYDDGDQLKYKSALLTIPLKSKSFGVREVLADNDGNVAIGIMTGSQNMNNYAPGNFQVYYYEASTGKLSQVKLEPVPEQTSIYPTTEFLNDDMGNMYFTGTYAMGAVRTKSRTFIYHIKDGSASTPIVIKREDYKDDEGKDISPRIQSLHRTTSGQLVALIWDYGFTPSYTVNGNIFALVYDDKGNVSKAITLHRYTEQIADRQAMQAVGRAGDNLYVIYNDDARNVGKPNATGLQKVTPKSSAVPVVAMLNLATGDVKKELLVNASGDKAGYIFNVESLVKVGDKEYMGLVTCGENKLKVVSITVE